LHVKAGETTPDGRISLEYAECLGACEHAPCILANDDLHKSVSQEQAVQLVNSLK
jgi:NADH-quinone oxidoreductase subunit E